MPTDKEINEIRAKFVAKMVHDLGHLVADLRARVDYLKRSVRLESRATDTVEKISLVTDNILLWLRSMRFLFSDESPILCDFVSDVLEPAVYLARHPRLTVHKSARTVPQMRIRTGTATMGLMFLFSAIDRPKISCKASVKKGTLVFQISAETSNRTINVEVQKRAVELLESSGVTVKLSPIHDGVLLLVHGEAIDQQ